jgi:hypothetical protein
MSMFGKLRPSKPARDKGLRARMRRPMRSPRSARDGENPRDMKRLGAKEQGWSKDGGFSEQVWEFLRDRLDPNDLEELAQMLQSGDEDLGGYVEEDEASPPYYGKYGQNVRGPLDMSSKAKRFQGGFQGASTGGFGATDSRMPTAREVKAFFARYPDAERLR